MKIRMITKRSGLTEKYSIDKIEKSMLGAGVTNELSKAVAKAMIFSEEISTKEVRRFVIGAIKNKEPQAAKRFETHPQKKHVNT